MDRGLTFELCKPPREHVPGLYCGTDLSEQNPKSNRSTELCRAGPQAVGCKRYLVYKMDLDQHSVMRANPNRHLPPDPPTITGGVLNPDPVPFPPPDMVVPVPPPPPAGTVRAGHPLLPCAAPPPPGAYSRTDPQLFWMNNRPFLLHRIVGKGGFGKVYSAELLLPPGMEVSRNPTTGGFFVDGAGRVEVRRQQRAPEDPLPTEDRPSPSGNAPPTDFMENTGASDEDVTEALGLSEPAPASMNFFHVEELTANADGTLGMCDRKKRPWCGS